MKAPSLQQIMNEMASRVDAIHPAPPEQRPAQLLSELDAFIQMDHLLASLHKDYLDAKAQRVELIALHGDADAMAEVAMDMEDSAWCAMQTRYLELREEREIMERAQRLMRRAEEKIQEEKARDKEYETKKLAYHLKIIDKVKEMNKTPNILEWALVLAILKVSPFHPRSHYSMQQTMAA